MKDSIQQIQPGAFAQSVAGGEDPGASVVPAASSPSPSSAAGATAPGDEAPPGTPGTGESPCRACGGSGRDDQGQPCAACAGTGKVTAGIGGG